MITKAPIVDSRSDLKLNQETLDRTYLDHPCDTFKINNAMVYQILSKMFMDMDNYIYVKQRKSMQDGQCFSMSISNFLALSMWSGRPQSQNGKLQSYHYDDERKAWDWNKYITLHKEQHDIIESLTDYGYSGMDDGTKVCPFLQGNKNTELEAAVNVVQAQLETYCTDFHAMVLYLGQIVTKFFFM